MANFSRRQLAKYAAQQLAEGQTAGLAPRLAAALVDSGRSKQADLLAADIRRELEDAGLLTDAEVSSAWPLPQVTLDKIASDIKRLTGSKQVNISSVVDQSLLGGLKVQTANHAWDMTVRRRLQTLKESM